MRLAFDDFEVDPDRFELRRAGVRIPLEPQVFNLLAYLVTHHGRVIRTVHSRGDRFEAPVREVAEPARGPAPVSCAVTDGLHIAYQVTGAGPRDKRGTGRSDRLPPAPSGSARTSRRTSTTCRRSWTPPAPAARPCSGTPRAAPWRPSSPRPHPDRVSALVLYGAYARRLRTADYPWAPTEAEPDAYGRRLADEWSWEAGLRVMCPSADDAMARWWGMRPGPPRRRPRSGRWSP